MESNQNNRCGCSRSESDHGPWPYTADIMRAAVSGQTMAIPVPDQMKDALRARCMKNMLTAVARQNRAQPG